MRVEIKSIGSGRKVAPHGLKKKAQKILRFLNQNCAELSLVLVGNRQIRRLNARYRRKDEPTDVLSFPLGEKLPSGKTVLGDVIISVEQAKKQAAENNKKLAAEMETLLIHGILHLLGFDHERSLREKQRMKRMEGRIHRSLCGSGKLKV